MVEIWKDICGYSNYQVSDQGRVRSKDRVTRISGSSFGDFRKQKGIILKPWSAKNTGYQQVDLGGERKIVHRLVAEAFCLGGSVDLEVNHLNGDRADNRAENLEWVTPSENMLHSLRELNRKTTAVAVIATSRADGSEKRFKSMQDAAESGFTKSEICSCCKGKKKSHKGFTWRYAELT